jgi:hypothetical protein
MSVDSRIPDRLTIVLQRKRDVVQGTSTSRATLAFLSRVKNDSADFLVNPIVKIFMPRHLSPTSPPRLCSVASSVDGLPRGCNRRTLRL